MKAYSMLLDMIAASAPTASAADDNPALSAAPNLKDDLRQIVLDELWERTELNKRDRSLVSATAAVVQGHTRALSFQFALALDNGVTPQELAGTLAHLMYYSGMPAALQAEPALADVLAQSGVKLSSLRVAEAQPEPDKATAQAQREVVLSMVGDVAPGLAAFSNTALNGDLWLRDDLAPRDRSLVTISALITQGNVEQLPVHIRKGMDNGLTRSEIGEAITQLAFYAGWPRVFSACTAFKAMELPE